MISKIRNSFRLRLTFMVLLSIIIPLTITLVFVINAGVENIETTAKNELEAQANLLTNATTSWNDRAELAVQSLSQQPDIVSMAPIRQRPALKSMATIYTEMFLIHTVDLAGDNVARSDFGDTLNYADRAWFQGSMAGDAITRETLLSRTTGEPSIAYSSPIRDSEGEIVGAALAVSTLTNLAQNFDVVDLGNTGFAYLVDENGIVLAHPNPAYMVDELVDLSALTPVAQVMAGNRGYFAYTDDEGVAWLTHLVPLDNGWNIVVQQERAEAVAGLPQFIALSIALSLVVLLIIGVLTWVAAGRAIRPIATLTTAATAVAAGNLNETVTIKQTDEIGILANAFNSMTFQLRDLVQNLEIRVAARVKDLELANEIGRNISEIHDSDKLLSDAVKIIHKGFDLYLTQIYLVEANEETILLRAAEGQAADRLLAQGHYLAITSASVNGTAVAEKRPVVVSDTANDPRFRPNPLLPDTRSEMAVPLLAANRAIGVLDIQSTVPHTFTDENIPAFVAMAGQLAIALENASLFHEKEAATTSMEAMLTGTEEQARRLTQLNEMGTSLAGAAKLDEVYQIIGSQILTLIEGDRASLALVTEGEESAEVFALQGKKGAIPTGTVLPFRGTAVGLAIQENRIVQLPQEFPLSSYADSRQLAQQGLQSLIVVPLNVSGQVTGTLNIGSIQPDAFSEADINFAQQIATLLASTIDSWNLVERVQSLATLVENHPDFIGIGTLTGEALYINPAGLALLGLPPNFDITNMGSADFYLPEDAERLQQEGIPTALETGSWTAEVRLRRADDTTLPVEQTIAINYDVEGKATNFSITMRDITERQQAAESQQRLTTQLEERLLQVNAMQRAMSHEGWSAFLTSPNRLVQGFKFDKEQIGLISTRDVEKGNVPSLTQTEREGTQAPDPSTAAASVDIRGETIGVIGAKNADGSPLTTEQTTLLQAMSQQVASALDRARLFEEMELSRQQMNALYAGSERVVRASSLQEVLDALIEATALKHMDRANFLFFDRSWTDEEPTTLTITAVWEKDLVRVTKPDYTPPAVGDQYTIDQLPSVRLVAKDKPALFPDITADDRLGPDATMLAERLGITSLVYFPLVVGEQWFGLLVAQSFNAISLTEDDIRQITSLIGQAASVSQTQRLFEQTQNRARREQLLREVSSKVYAAPDAEAVMKTAVREINRIMGVDSFVYLNTPTTQQPSPTNGHHLETEETLAQDG